MTSSGLHRAKYGAAAYTESTGQIPSAFPRIMGPNCLKYLQEVIDSGLTVDMVGRFEAAFAQAMGVKHCIATPGCTPALAALARAFSFEPGDEIIVSPITDYGTLQGLISEQYIPVFADAEPGTINLSARTIEPCITDRTRAILAVHMTGLICDMDPINELAERRGLVVYEDACQSLFGEYKGRLAGSLALAAGFSFDSEKTLGSDVGGCLITDDDELAERIRYLGQSRGAVQVPGFGREHRDLGYAYRMTQCTAAICLGQLEIIRDSVRHRDQMARLLSELLSEIPGIAPLAIPGTVNVYSCWMVGFAIRPEAFGCTAAEFAQQMVEAGVPGAGQGRYYLMPEACTFLQRQAAAQVYPYSMPPASRTYSYGSETCPNARAYLEHFIRWSSFSAKYEPEHCYRIADIVRDIAARNRR